MSWLTNTKTRLKVQKYKVKESSEIEAQYIHISEAIVPLEQKLIEHIWKI